MKILKNIKYLNIALFILMLLFVLLVMASIQENSVEAMVYYYLAMIVITGVAFLSINLLSFEKKVVANSIPSEVISKELEEQS